jgi:hypothetical protein
MVQVFLIGVSAGVAAALLFASVASGSWLAILLFYLAPLPILIAAIGWSHWAALIAAIVAAVALGAAFGFYLCAVFLIGIGLPAWWLGYLALLARPAPTAANPEALEWYPVGHLVTWAAIVGALIVIGEILNIGATEESFRDSMQRGIERVLRSGRRTGSPDQGLSRQIVDFLVVYLPVAAGVLTTLVSLVSLVLATQVVKLSGRLRRPWPNLSTMHFPVYAPALTGAAVAGFFLPGLPGIAAGVLMGSMLTAYAVLGFAVLHAITLGARGRPFALGGAYAAVLVLGWPALIMALLGLADTAFDLRRRSAGGRGPTNPRT